MVNQYVEGICCGKGDSGPKRGSKVCFKPGKSIFLDDINNNVNEDTSDTPGESEEITDENT